MTARTRRATVVGALLLVLMPTMSMARIDDTAPIPIPGEAPAQLLDGTAYAAVTVDVGGEAGIVRLVAASNGSGDMAVDAWAVPSISGPAELVDEAPIRRDASVEESFSALPRPAADGTLPLRVSDAARLLVVRDGDARRVIVAAIGATGPDVRPCCLTLYEVQPGARTFLRRVGGIQQDARAVVAADLDGDGTDEIVAVEDPDAAGLVPLRVYWPFDPGRRPAAALFDVTAVDPASLIVAETDGRAGDDVIFAAIQPVPGRTPVPVLGRLTLAADGPRTEIAALRQVASPVALPRSGGAVLILPSPVGDTTASATWPPGGPLHYEAQVLLAGTALGVIGSGADARLLLRPGSDAAMVVPLDAALVTGTPIRGSPAAISFPAISLRPYVGPWPGGGQVFLGTLIADDGVATQIASLVGAIPVGRVGARAASMVLAFNMTEPRSPVLARAAPAGQVGIVALDDVLRPEVDGGRLGVGLRGAAVDPADAGRLLTRDLAFDVIVAAPPSALVLAARNRQADVDGTSMVLVGAAEPITVSPDLTVSATTLSVVVVTVAGGAYHGEWEVERRTAPPALDVDASALTFSSTVPIRGTTTPGAAVTVNDAAVHVDAAGRFATSVEAGLVPVPVTVVASDVLDNRAAATISAVGWVDYRRLPWIPFVAVLTLVAAFLLWLRVPRPRRWDRHGPEDDAVLEELDG